MRISSPILARIVTARLLFFILRTYTVTSRADQISAKIDLISAKIDQISTKIDLLSAKIGAAHFAPLTRFVAGFSYQLKKSAYKWEWQCAGFSRVCRCQGTVHRMEEAAWQPVCVQMLARYQVQTDEGKEQGGSCTTNTFLNAGGPSYHLKFRSAVCKSERSFPETFWFWRTIL